MVPAHLHRLRPDHVLAPYTVPVDFARPPGLCLREEVRTQECFGTLELGKDASRNLSVHRRGVVLPVEVEKGVFEDEGPYL